MAGKFGVVVAAVAVLWGAPTSAHESGSNARGVVESVSAERLVVKASDGHVTTFALTPETRFERRDEPVASSDVRVGERAIVRGKNSGDTLQAVVVKLAPATER
jgi:hypothetical protein